MHNTVQCSCQRTFSKLLQGFINNRWANSAAVDVLVSFAIEVSMVTRHAKSVHRCMQWLIIFGICLLLVLCCVLLCLVRVDICLFHDDVIKWNHFPRYWPFVWGIHRSPVNSLHKGQWRGALMFSLICARINGWVNNGEAGDLRRHRAHYDATVMSIRVTALALGLQWPKCQSSDPNEYG